MDLVTNPLSTDGTQQRKDSKNFGKKMEAELLLFDRVFRNDLIANKIAPYLNLADLKDASASCRSLYEMVRNSKHFKEIAKLCLSQKNLQESHAGCGTGMTTCADKSGHENLASSPSETTTMKTFHGLSVIEVDLVVSKEIPEFLQGNQNFLKNFQTVHLIGNSRAKEVTVAILHYIFVNTSVITLQIDGEVATCLNLADHFATQTGKEYFTKLRNLEIVSKERDEFDCPIFHDNIKYFYALPLNLKKLEIGKVGYNFKCYENIVNLIIANAGSIQDLVLDFKETCPWGTTQFENIRLPLLKKLVTSLTDGGAEIDNFLSFMKKQPLVEELSLCVVKKCGPKLLTVIQERGSKLKKLHLRAKHFGDGENWGFLADMQNLKDFALIRPIIEWRDALDGSFYRNCSLLDASQAPRN
ncbi:uncharacterized protein LOC118433140 [Folsomia candida]|uniref:uncharacterized protein LOC118433140 n=1 Tax=Folsomia candida TaxID=158441 RepID=UPI001604E085|nr:uncharacterized protein LOC118433140 [Folsomia candida]